MDRRRSSTRVLPTDTDMELLKKLDVQVNRWRLRFKIDNLEDAFVQYHHKYIARKLRRLVLAYGAFEFAYGVVEFILRQHSTPEPNSQLIIRAAVCALCLVVYGNPFNIMHAKFTLLTVFNTMGALLLLLQSLAAKQQPGWYMFTLGNVSLADTLTFIIVCSSGSGLIARQAIFSAWLHAIASLVLQASFFGTRSWFSFRCLAPLFLAYLCSVAAYHLESDMRDNFLMRCVISEDRTRRDTLIHAMLPSEIVTALKSEQRDNLSRPHSDVAILFCIISNFSANSVHTTATDLVVMLSKVFEAFDRATELHGAFKVENVADTYMVATGCPRYDPAQTAKIAQLALSMMKIVDEYNWQWASREPVRVQIGIHTGDVVGGVVGHKTYAYHLFGDAVNTSSRMCTHGEPGKIHMSEAAHQLLLRQSSKFITEARGVIPVKGKGDMATFWLKDCIDPTYKEVVAKVRADADQPIQLKYNAELESSSTDSNLLELVSVTPWTLSYTIPSSTIFVQSDGLVAYAPNHAVSPAEEEFLEELEISFEDAYARKTSTLIFNVLLAAAIVSLVALLIISTGRLATWHLFWVLVSTVVAASGLAMIGALCVHQRWVGRRIQFVGTSCCFLLCLAQLPLVFADDAPNVMPVIIFGLVALGLLMDLRFMYTLFAGSGLVIAYLVATAMRPLHTNEFVAITLHTCMILALVVYGGYRRERSIRRDFIHFCLLHEEHTTCEELIRNMLPIGSHAEQLLQGNLILDELDNVTVLYADIVDFTPLCSQIPPAELYQLLNTVYSAFDAHLDAFGLYKVETIGDTFIVIGGLPGYQSVRNHALAVLTYAFHMLQELEIIRESKGIHVKVRVGIHTGRVVGSVPSLRNPRYLLWGNSAVVAPALEGACQVGTINVSNEMYNALPLDQVEDMGITLVEQEPHPKTERFTSRTFKATCNNISQFFRRPPQVPRPTILTRSMLGQSSSSEGTQLRSPKVLKFLNAIEQSLISRWWRGLFPVEQSERTFGGYEVRHGIQVLRKPGQTLPPRNRFASAFTGSA